MSAPVAGGVKETKSTLMCRGLLGLALGTALVLGLRRRWVLVPAALLVVQVADAQRVSRPYDQALLAVRRADALLHLGRKDRARELLRGVAARELDTRAGAFARLRLIEHDLADLAPAVQNALAIFIAVGTPPDEDGSADLQYVLAVASSIAGFCHWSSPDVIRSET